MAGGSLIGWAVFREGTAESWVRGDLETLLAAYRRYDEEGDEDNGFNTKKR